VDFSISKWKLQEDIDAINVWLETMRHDSTKAPLAVGLMKHKAALIKELVNAMRDSTEYVIRADMSEYIQSVGNVLREELPKDLLGKTLEKINALEQP
jgi:hypothetical protein